MVVFMIVCVCNAFNQHSISRIIQIDFLILVFHLNDVDCFDSLPLEFIHIVSFPVAYTHLDVYKRQMYMDGISKTSFLLWS